MLYPFVSGSQRRFASLKATRPAFNSADLNHASATGIELYFDMATKRATVTQAPGHCSVDVFCVLSPDGESQEQVDLLSRLRLSAFNDTILSRGDGLAIETGFAARSKHWN